MHLVAFNQGMVPHLALLVPLDFFVLLVLVPWVLLLVLCVLLVVSPLLFLLHLAPTVQLEDIVVWVQLDVFPVGLEQQPHLGVSLLAQIVRLDSSLQRLVHYPVSHVLLVNFSWQLNKLVVIIVHYPFSKQLLGLEDAYHVHQVQEVHPLA